MDSVRSAENILRWRSQFHRVGLAPDEAISDIEKLDFFLAFFMNCYALRDWFIQSRAVPKSEMDRLVFADGSMRLCRDICNRSKHLSLTRDPSVDAHYQIAREYDHYDKTARWFILAAGTKRDLFDLASGCMDFWRLFLREHANLPETPYP